MNTHHYEADQQQAPSPSSSCTLTFEVLPTAESERRRLGRWFKRADFQPTGLFAHTSIDLTVVTPEPGEAGITLQLIVGTHGFQGKSATEVESPRTYSLKPGANVIQDPLGGVMWFRAVSDETDGLPRQVTVEFTPTNSSLRPLPVYRHGITTHLEWLMQLLAWAPTYPVQLISDRIVITAWCSTAMDNLAQDPALLLDEYAYILDRENEMAAIGTEPGQTPDSPLRILVSEKVGGNPNASHYRISLPRYGREFMTVEGLRRSWGVWHELGHMQHQIAWSANALTENSVNIFSLAVQRSMRQPSRAVPYDASAHAFLNSPAPDFGKVSNMVAMVMWEQLRTAFGHAFFHRLHQETRANGNSDSGQGDAQYRHYFMVTSCKAARADLTRFFTRWGWHPQARTLEEIESLGLPAPDPDPSTLHIQDATYISQATRDAGSIVIVGTAQRGSRLKTTNDPGKGWYDPEAGKVFANADTGAFTLRTQRSINGQAAVKSYDPQTGVAISESNHMPIEVSMEAFDDELCHCLEHGDQ
ncbi:M60 family metallopeptidase [Pseudomonas guariconensis]|uniref:M60 family metallopeptidase n=1 Tax=Pseudomonas guariconensis TaxID=1288410 RepID=UPI00209A63D8|nr:M60 family metallopeptidase [Pseudomonas guariconensis]MCO7632995.1 M60 family metallopeptidase [Pseudomonas guariconensis]